MEGSHPALPAEPGTLKATLPDTPAIAQMTERESAHPSYQQLEQLSVLTNGVTNMNVNAAQKVPSSNNPDGDKAGSPLSPVSEAKVGKTESQTIGRASVTTVRILFSL